MNTSMRDAFLDELYDIARQDKRVMLISNDFGAPSLDKFREDCAAQFIHIGIAEQNMVNVATGLALAGKIVYMYSIAPFLPLRCYEQLRVHLSFKNFHITGVVVGAGYAYDLSGPTHHALEDIARSFGGVAESYALQAGREIRIIVRPDEIDDLATVRLSKDIASKIEEGMEYPGQIKVTVIREVRAEELAK